MRIDSLLKGGISGISFGYNTKLDGYTTLMSDIPKLCAIRKPAFEKGDHKFMTLLPSFNERERRNGKEIPTNRDYLITGVKRLPFASPNFFLTRKRGVPYDEKKQILIYICRHLELNVIDMPSKNVTLSVDEDLYNRYREFCKKRGWLISRQFEIMMEEKMEGDNQ